jgi:hypothetical protein
VGQLNTRYRVEFGLLPAAGFSYDGSFIDFKGGHCPPRLSEEI